MRNSHNRVDKFYKNFCFGKTMNIRNTWWLVLLPTYVYRKKPGFTDDHKVNHKLTGQQQFPGKRQIIQKKGLKRYY